MGLISATYDVHAGCFHVVYGKWIMLCVDSDYQPDLFLTPLDLVDEILIRIWKMLEFKKICDAFTRK